MRTSIEIDDQLMQEAMRSTGARTKKAVVRLLVKTHGQTGIRQLCGKVKWHGDVNESRQGHVSRPG